jgi:hypothetical protein
MYDDQEDTPAVPEVVQPTGTLSTHREQVCKGIKEGLMKHFKEIAEKEYQTSVDVTSSDKPLVMNVNIKTNDPRVIAALAAAGGV